MSKKNQSNRLTTQHTASIDKLTAANYGMPINTNLCENKFVKHKDKLIMLQAASIYTQGNGEKWNPQAMFDVML